MLCARCEISKRNGTKSLRLSLTERREVVNGAKRIRSEKLNEHQHMERYPRCLECMRVEWGEDRNVGQMWEQVKRAIVNGVRWVCGSVIEKLHIALKSHLVYKFCCFACKSDQTCLQLKIRFSKHCEIYFRTSLPIY